MRHLRPSLLLIVAVLAACGGDAEGGQAGGGETGGGAEQPPAARVADGKPVGLFFMTRVWPATGSLEEAVWYFAPDGRVFQNLANGFSPEELAAHQGGHGTFEVAGDQLTVKWSDGTTTESALQRSETGFSWNAGIFTPIKPFARGQSIAGTYGGGQSFSSDMGGASASQTLQLNPDGTFGSVTAGSVESATSESQVSAGSQGGGAGTWRVEGYTLVMTQPDGSTERSFAFPYDDASTPAYPDRLFIGGTMYTRQ